MSVAPFDGLVRDFVVARGGEQSVVRGVRGVTDFDYRHQLAGMNNMAPDVEAVFLTPAATLQSVSSTLIREISQLGGDVAPYVSPRCCTR